MALQAPIQSGAGGERRGEQDRAPARQQHGRGRAGPHDPRERQTGEHDPLEQRADVGAGGDDDEQIAAGDDARQHEGDPQGGNSKRRPSGLVGLLRPR
jgi:hypothetical protein